MYKESLNGSEQKPTSKKGVIALFLAGTACVAVGMAGYNAVQEQKPEYLELKAEAELTVQFYESIAQDCNNYYSESSQTFAKGARNFNKEIEFAAKHKLIMARYANDGFHTAKGAMIDELDDLRDAQRDIESTTSYLNRTVKKMGSKIEDGAWKFQMKYSTMFNKKCVRDAGKLATRYENLKISQKTLGTSLKMMEAVFKVEAMKDVTKWDCAAMYPPPEKFSVDWIGAIQDAGEQGYAVYDQVKGMIPEGEGASKGIPGLPAGIAAGPSEEVTELPVFGGETDSDFEKRQKMYTDALAQCRSDRHLFGQEIMKVSAGIQQLSTHNPFGKFERFPEDVEEKVNHYNSAAKRTIVANAQISEEEMPIVKSYNKKLVLKVGQTLEAAKVNGQKVLAQKTVLFK